MNNFWQELFNRGDDVEVVLKDIVKTDDCGNGTFFKECVIAATDGSLEVCAMFDDFDPAKYRAGDIYRIKLAFKCDYEYMLPAVFEDEAELVSYGIIKSPIYVIIGQNENGDDEPLATAILCGKIIAMKEFGGAHIFEVEYGDKTFPVVFFGEKPNAKVGDILHGEFDVFAKFSSTCEK